jgi:hypothetical protein
VAGTRSHLALDSLAAAAIRPRQAQGQGEERQLERHPGALGQHRAEALQVEEFVHGGDL